MQSYRDQLDITARDRLFVCTPMFHGCAVYYAATLTLMSGGSIVIVDKFSVAELWAQVQRSGATIVWTLGTIVTLLLLKPPTDAERTAAEQLRFIFASGIGRRRSEVHERWQRPVLDGYGMTEIPGTLTGFNDYATADGPYASVGKPVAGVNLRIVNPESGAPLPPGAIGEIVVDSSVTCLGYLGNPEASAAALRDGWFHTGDRGVVDESGELRFVDRLKDIVRRAGENISSAEVEGILATLDSIAQVAIVPASHDQYGEIVCAVIVSKDGITVPTLDEIRAHCEGRLAQYKWPERLLVVSTDQFPTTPTGKVRKGLLKTLVADRKI
jgi:acyl-CoA synthetase (AMP-forming)/AMP-acid ligase II